MRSITLFFMIFLVSCSSGIPLKSVNLDPLFHDGNSKVWMVDMVIAGNKNFAPRINIEKDVFVFYENGKCLYQPLRTLGELDGKHGQFSVFSQDRNISIHYPHEVWDFKLTTITEDTLILTPTKQSDLKYKIVLVPLPEL